MNQIDYKYILSKLSMDEKIALCSGSTNWLTEPNEKNGIPAVWVSDGPHGLRKEKMTKGVNVMQESEKATCFPPAVSLASSWDKNIALMVGDAIADEAKALQVTTVLGPGVNIKRSPLCGRNFEYFSEDPYLAGRIGAAWVHGVQQKSVGTSLKHFIANNQEYIRMSIDSIVDERALREIYMPAFEHIVKTEQPTTVMSSYNKLNGTYLSDNKRILTDVLRDEWGFKGIVVSDWGSVNSRPAGIKAGMDLEMPTCKGMNDIHIKNAIESGEVTEEELDTIALRMIKFAYESKANEVTDFVADFDKSHQVALEASLSSAVLLKNESDTLPLKKSAKIAVIGKLAQKIRYQGAGSSHINTTQVVSFVDALKENNADFEYADGYSLKGTGYNKKLIEKAVETAKGKDTVVVFVGLTDAYESEGYDRKHMNLPDSHNILIEELLRINKNIVVVLSCGSPVKIGAWEKHVRAILNMYLPGQAGGTACYQLLFGDRNPSGKLAETFPLKNHHNVVANYFPMGPRCVQYRESIFVGYRYFDTVGKAVQYPFGFGLSYTKFEYSDLKLSSNKINEGDTLTVTFKIKNIGKCAGAEIAELYVGDKVSSVYRPSKELKGFDKVMLDIGEEKTVELTLDSRSFSYYNTAINDWHIESGEFDIMIGASVDDIRLQSTVDVVSANPDAPIPDFKTLAPVYYDIANGKETNCIPSEQFEAILGAELPNNEPYKKGELTFNNSIGQIAITPLGKFVSRCVALGSKIMSRDSENPEMIVNSAQDMPLRSASAMTGGLLPFESLQGFVDMLNGKKGGMKRFINGIKNRPRTKKK